MNPYVKLGLCFAVIVGGVILLTQAAGSVDGGTAYYVHPEEIGGLGEKAYARRLQVAGQVQEKRYEGSTLLFTILGDEGGELPVRFDTNLDVLPDNFDDEVMVIVQGKLQRDGTLEANKIQTKCTSKYEADFNEKRTRSASQEGARGSSN